MELLGLAEIAMILGVSRQRADQLVRQKGFPDALEELSAGRVWSAAAVIAWAQAQNRWPALNELYGDLAEAAQHCSVTVEAHGPAGDGMKRATAASTRAVLVLKVQFGSAITTRNASLWAIQERIARALIEKDPVAIAQLALQAAELATRVLSSSGARAPEIDIDMGFEPDDANRPSTWPGMVAGEPQ